MTQVIRYKEEIPLMAGAFFRRRTNTVAKLREVTEKLVIGEIINNNGYPIPFCVCHNHESFKVGEMVFRFGDWNL